MCHLLNLAPVFPGTISADRRDRFAGHGHGVTSMRSRQLIYPMHSSRLAVLSGRRATESSSYLAKAPPLMERKAQAIMGWVNYCTYLGGRQNSRQTAVDGKYLSGDVLAGIACKQDRRAFEVVLVTDATQRGTCRKFVRSDGLERALCHLRRKESRRERIDSNPVATPIAGQRTSEIHDRALARVVRNHLHIAYATAKASNRSDIDDPAVPVRYH
jgi:hypothetical protein